MKNPYKTRENGATVTIFVPYDCGNNCPFCINKKEYANPVGFSTDKIIESIRTMHSITPKCDFVFTGGEPFANLTDLQRMLDEIPTTHRVFINTTLPTFKSHTEDDIRAGHLAKLGEQVRKYGVAKVCAKIGVGEPTLLDMIAELEKPGRDIRDAFDAPVLREDVMSLEDLKPDMILTGTVRNVTDFGAFVDIGVHQDGLVHISQLSNKFIKHPSEAVSLGDVVKVKVLAVDVKKKRISLTMKFKE